MSLSNSLRAFLTVEWLHCSGGRSSSLGQLWRKRGDTQGWRRAEESRGEDGKDRDGGREDGGQRKSYGTDQINK